MPALLLSTLARSTPLSLGLGLSLGISSFFAAQSILNTQAPSRYALRCDAGALGTSSSSGVAGGVGDMLNRVGVGAGGYERYEREAKTPVTKGGRLNPGAVRQMSVGSIAGELCVGVACVCAVNGGKGTEGRGCCAVQLQPWRDELGAILIELFDEGLLGSAYLVVLFREAQPLRSFLLTAFVPTRCWRIPIHHPSPLSPLPCLFPSLLSKSKLTFPPAFAGLLSGLTVSLFSKPLALLLGLLVLGIQGLEYQGIHIVPYGRLQRWFTNTDVKSALRDNVALKVSFGTAFALAGFVSL